MTTNYEKAKIQFRRQKLTSLLEETAWLGLEHDGGPLFLTKCWLKASHDESLGQVLSKVKVWLGNTPWPRYTCPVKLKSFWLTGILMPTMGNQPLINHASCSIPITCHEIFRAKNAFHFKWSPGLSSNPAVRSGFIIVLHRLDVGHKLRVPREAPNGGATPYWRWGIYALQDEVTGGMARAQLSDLGLLGPVPSLTLALLRDSHGLPQSVIESI